MCKGVWNATRPRYKSLDWTGNKKRRFTGFILWPNRMEGQGRPLGNESSCPHFPWQVFRKTWGQYHGDRTCASNTSSLELRHGRGCGYIQKHLRSETLICNRNLEVCATNALGAPLRRLRVGSSRRRSAPTDARRLQRLLRGQENRSCYLDEKVSRYDSVI
jgi:hypothetical protein